MSVSRRKFFQLAGATALSSISPLLQAQAHAKQAPKELSLLNLHTGERARCTYWDNGQYQWDALQQLNTLLRDHRNDQVTQIDPLLLDQVHAVQQLMGHRGEVHIISGYRSPESNEKLRQMGHKVAKRSFHLQGRAIDIRLPKQPLAQVRKAALNMQAGGVGYYPRSNFLHLDTGRVRQWG